MYKYTCVYIKKLYKNVTFWAFLVLTIFVLKIKCTSLCYNTSITTLHPHTFFFSLGVILDTDRRASMPTLVYLRSILGLSELVWTCLGTKWLYYNRHSWDPTTVAVVSAGVISRLV